MQKVFTAGRKITLFLVMALVIAALSACSGNNNGGTTATNPPAETTSTTSDTPSTATDDTPVATEDETVVDDSLSAVDFDDPFPGADLGGATIYVDWENPYADDLDEYKREQLMEAKDLVESKFNCKLVFDRRSNVEWSEVPSAIIASIAAGDPLLDMGDMSITYWVPDLIIGDCLIDVTDFIQSYGFPKAYYEYSCEWKGRTYGFTKDVTTPFSSIVFNRDLIKSVGMELDPGEMFAAGRWSHEEFFNYMLELKSKLPEDVITLGLLPVNWARAASYANDSFIKDPRTYVPGYLEDGYIEVMELYRKMVQAGIGVQPVWLEDQERFTFGHAETEFLEGKRAMCHGDDWNFASFAAAFDFGVVPYPWGPKVSIQGTDYTTLSDGYRVPFKDAGVRCFFKGSEKKATPEQLTNMLFTYYPESADMLLENMQRDSQGLPAIKSDYGTLRNFSTDLDVELWDWMMTRGKFEPLDMITTSSAYALAQNKGCATNESFRVEFEAALGEDVWGMIEYGFMDRNDLPADMLAKAEAYHNAQEAGE